MFVERVKQNAAKAAIWLAVAMLALPAIPASACSCPADRQASDCGCCGRQGLDQAEQPHDGHTTRSCCNKESSTATPSHGCSCGKSCTCKSGPRPAQPAEPLPLKKDSPIKVVGAGSHAGLSAPITQPADRPLVVSSGVPAVLNGSLKRCIFLSRFTL